MTPIPVLMLLCCQQAIQMISRAHLTPYPCLVSMQLLNIQLMRKLLLNFALQ